MCPLEMEKGVRVCATMAFLGSTIFSLTFCQMVNEIKAEIHQLVIRRHIDTAQTFEKIRIKERNVLGVKIAVVIFAVMALTAIGVFIGAKQVSGMIN